jgi:hypothetical protein
MSTLARGVALLVALAAVDLLASPAEARAETITWNFTSSSGSEGTIGNTRTFTVAGITVKVTAWGYTYGSLDNAFQAGAVGQWSTGLGARNVTEPSGSPDHQVDNAGPDDWLLLTFSDQMDFESFRIDPYGTYDRDVRYYIGNVDPNALPLDLTGETYGDLAALGFTSYVDDFGSVSGSPRDVAVSGIWGNAILIGTVPYPTGYNDSKDFFKLTSFTATVTPEPTTLLLLAGGLGGLWLGTRRRKR